MTMYDLRIKRSGPHLSLKARILFYDRLALYLRSGIPIREALALIRDSEHQRPTRETYARLLDTVMQGTALSRALDAAAFPRFETHVLYVGEQSGRLPQNLAYLASLLRRKQLLLSKIRTALAYPLLVACGSIALTVFLLVYSFPKIIPLFRGLHSTLPPSTRALVGVSDFLGDYGLVLLAGSALCAVAAALALRLPPVRHKCDRVVLHLFVVGSFSRSYHLAVFSRTLSSLLGSGIPLLPALGLARDGTRQSAYRDVLGIAQHRVSAGAPLSQTLREHTFLFPPALTGLVASGEATGSLAESFSAVAEICEAELDERTHALTTLIEPVLMIFMGLVVGWIAVAIVSPIYGLTQNLAGH